MGRCDAFYGEHPVHLLQKVIDDPIIAQYPTSLHLGEPFSTDDQGVEDYEPEEIEAAKSMLQHLDQGLLQSVTQLSSLKRCDAEEWITHIEEAIPGAIYLLLFTLLPRLRRINFQGRYDPDLWFLKALEHLSCSGQTSHSMKTKVLGRLFNVSMAARDDGCLFDAECEMDVLRPFMRFPSLRCVSGSLIDFEVREPGLALWTDRDYKTGVVEINFTNSDVMTMTLSDLFARTQNLRRFRHHGAGFHCMHNYQPRMNLGALEKYARHSLVSLDLTARNNVRFYGDAILDRDLRTFAQLREIFVDYDMFLSATASCQKCKETFRACCHCRPSRRLVDILPSSVEKVTLVGLMSTGQALLTLGDLIASSWKPLPELREVGLNSPILKRQEVVKAYENIGIALIESKLACGDDADKAMSAWQGPE